MDWYYAKDEQQVGPIDQSQFEALVGEGAIGLSTLVWHQDMADWQPYGEVATQAPAPVAAGTASCAECGRSFPVDEMVSYSGSHVCAECKPIFFQRVREGVPLDQGFEYGGFWIRFGAKVIDNIIISAVQVPVLLLATMGAASSGESAAAVYSLLSVLMTWGLPVAYTVFFLGKFGATPGKMACGLKVVRPTGERITYLRALGRWFAEVLSAMIFLIGYIMAAFDDEKRTLHDRICDTRVVRAR